MVASEMEVLAAEDALRRSGVPRSSVGALMTYTQLPDYLILPTAARVHQQLGLRSQCFSLGTEGACNSFLMQLHLADQMIRTGAIECALLIQSSQVQHLIRPEDEHSTWFGDGATAVVVGRVPSGEGVLHTSNLTDGSLYRVLVGGCPGKRWYEGEPARLYFEDQEGSGRMIAQLPDMGKRVLDDCLQATGFTPGDVDFYAAHQGTVWFRRVTQEHAGMSRARYFDSYPWTTSLGAANIPFELALAQREGMLRKGELVAAHSGGSGIVVSGTLMRWCAA
jgi:3-oxoacyl-[acyl-carrier-protein] synthase-3